VSKLNFDRENPRLVEFDLGTSSTDEDILGILIEAMDVRELVMSMASSGFFAHEPLIAIPDGDVYTVIEGNRRLAALKLLLDPSLSDRVNFDCGEVSEDILQSLREVPVQVTTRLESWQYLGFKHVNGPARWGSYAKAQYVARVHRDFDIELGDIAQQIGDSHTFVRRVFRGLMVIEQAERMGVFDRGDTYRSSLAFSHLYTGLGYDGVRDYLQISDEMDERIDPVPEENKDKLGKLLMWLYGSRRDNRPPLVRSQNPDLRNLSRILVSDDALRAVERGDSLDVALELTYSPSGVFAGALRDARDSLRKARSVVTGGYDGSIDLLKLGGSVAELADALYVDMEKIHTGEPRKRVTEDG